MRFLFRVSVYIVLAVAVVLFSLSAYVFAETTFIYPLKYKDEIMETADRYNLDYALVFSVVKVESGFRERAESERGARGLMQITQPTANYIAELRGIGDYDLFRARDNLDFGCYYLRYLVDKFINSETALCAYNAGEGRVISWLKDERYSYDGITLYLIPYAETENYVKKIGESLAKYRKLYGNLLDKRKNIS